MLHEGGGTADHNDTVDIVFQSTQKTIEKENDEGKIEYLQILDDLSLWCKTGNVASNKGSQVIYQMMEFMRIGLTADKHMCRERAKIWRDDTLAIVESIKKTIDFKSSESVVDHQNKQSTLIDKINKNSVEKIYTMKNTKGKSLFDTILNRDVEKDDDS